MESLTQELADKAWAMIEEIEAAGGMAKAIETGMPKLKIEESAARKQARIDRGDDVIVGVNKYRLAQEDDIDILDIDNVAVRESQVKRLADIRGKRDEKAVEHPQFWGGMGAGKHEHGLIGVGQQHLLVHTLRARVEAHKAKANAHRSVADELFKKG